MSDQHDHPALQTLQEAAQGLLFPSETDAPLVPFFWPDADANQLTPARVQELAGAPADTLTKNLSLASFFRPVTKSEEWHNVEEAAEVERFQALVKTLKATLKKPEVWRVGDEPRITAFVVGSVEGGWVGLQTELVET